MGTLPVKKGLSANAIRNIPSPFDPNWFRRFVTDHLQNADYRNAIAGPGISITGSENLPGTIALAGTTLSGFGTPTNGAVIANYNASTATTAQTAQVVAELIAVLKSFGVLGS
jgi:hypothetical protein